MSQYQTGTVDVAAASQTVDGTSTLWLANVAIGDLFKVTGYDAHYTVANIVSDTELTLNAGWAGSTLFGHTYQIVRDFTPIYNIPEIWVGDKDWPYHLTQGLRIIDGAIAGTASVESHGDITTKTFIVTDFSKIHTFSNTATCTVFLPSVDATNIGSWLEIRKKGAGALEIYAADSDIIMIAGDTQISNYDSAPTFDFIKLFLESATHWGCNGLYGPWETT